VGCARQLRDAAGEVAFVAWDRCAVGLAFGLRARDELDRLMAAGAGDGDAVGRRVDLAVAAAIETMPVGLT
jgi:hypothetical protein